MSTVEWASTSDPTSDPGSAAKQAGKRSFPERLRRWTPRSLTARLITGAVVLVVVLVAAIGMGTYFALRSSLLDKFGLQLASTTGQNAVYFSRCILGTDGLRCDGPPPTQKEWVAILDPATGVVTELQGTNSLVLPLRLSPTQRRQLTDNPMQVLTVGNGADKLWVSAAVGQHGLIVATGLSTEDVHGTLRRLVALELILGGVAVAFAMIVTSSGVSLALRRLRRVTSTAQEVALQLSPDGAGLDRRVPDAEEETEVGQLATSMNTLLAAVETQFAARVESEDRMRRFLADASHELRTPLTSIRGYAELARMQRGGGQLAADGEYDNLDRIEAEGTRMSRLVEDLLLLARGDRGAPPARELVDVSELIDDAVSSARAAFPDRRIEIDATPPYPVNSVIGDNDQLLRVLRNLINNAAVHTRPDAPIRVRGIADGSAVLLQVADGGPGLPPDEAAHVFERFWRADKARTRQRGGSGLGLSIVASIVQAHGGTVRFDSSVETGSTVTVRLPAVYTGSDPLTPQ